MVRSTLTREWNWYLPMQLLRDFDFQLVYPKTPWKEEQYSVFVINDFWVKITERRKKKA